MKPREGPLTVQLTKFNILWSLDTEQRGDALQLNLCLKYNRMLFASTIGDHEARQKYVDRDFDNGIWSDLCYRNFLIFTNKGQPIGRGNRVLPQCVVVKMRGGYPDPSGK